MASALMPLQLSDNRAVGLSAPSRSLPVPWKNLYAVTASELAKHIETLELACGSNPHSADLQTCLGMAYAMNYQVYESLKVLEKARELDGHHFYAQFKYAELLYRLRALPKAEQETAKSISLATNAEELAAARRQLGEIRQRIREGTQKPEWNKPLRVPAFALAGLFVVLSFAVVLLR